MAGPSVYAAITAITAELAGAGIPKNRTNAADQYQYRSIDDVFNRLAPLLAKHRLCVLPQVLERLMTERLGDNLQLLISVTLRVAFTLVSAEDGSSHTAEAYGEALDPSDKATAKAMSAAYKSAMLQTFCIPVGDADDPDAGSHKLARRTHAPEPVQGWDQWAQDIADIVGVCESEQAIDTIQDRNRELLKALGRERADLYAELGVSFTGRRELLRSREKAVAKPRRVAAASAESKRSEKRLSEAENA
jgi:hypothetical protein